MELSSSLQHLENILQVQKEMYIFWSAEYRPNMSHKFRKYFPRKLVFWEEFCVHHVYKYQNYTFYTLVCFL